MGVFQKTLQMTSRGRCHVQDITAAVEQAVRESGIRTGIVNVAGVGSTVGVTTMEFEPGCVADFQRALDQIAPPTSDYAHNARWGDDNGYSHLRSALVGTEKTFPVREGRLGVGTWQQIVLCDFDDRPRQRQIIVTVVGE